MLYYLFCNKDILFVFVDVIFDVDKDYSCEVVVYEYLNKEREVGVLVLRYFGFWIFNVIIWIGGII